MTRRYRLFMATSAAAMVCAFFTIPQDSVLAATDNGYGQPHAIGPSGIPGYVNPFGMAGDVLVTRDLESSGFYYGHAGIVYDQEYNVSALETDGVQKYPNSDWYNYTNWGSEQPLNPTIGYDASRIATEWLGKPYLLFQTDDTATNGFYCSKVVWLAYYDAGLNIDTQDTWDDGIIYPESLWNGSAAHQDFVQVYVSGSNMWAK